MKKFIFTVLVFISLASNAQPTGYSVVLGNNKFSGLEGVGNSISAIVGTSSTLNVVTRNTSWNDFEFNATNYSMLVDRTEDCGAIIFRYTGGSSFYALTFHKAGWNNNVTLRLKNSNINNNNTVGQISSYSEQISGATKIKINVVGNAIKIYVNDVLRINTTDNSLASGSVGFAIGNQWESLNLQFVSPVFTQVSSAPTVTVSPSSASICSGQSTTLTASGATTYSWSPSTDLSATTGTTPITGATVIANPTTTTTYTVTGTTAGQSSTKTVTVTVNPVPSISVSPSSPTICSGGNVSLIASGASTYSWTTLTNQNPTTGATLAANPAITTLYTIVGTGANGCVASGTVNVTVNPAPSISISPSNPSVCQGQSVSLTASGANTYTWNPTTNPTTGATLSANPSVTTLYTVLGTGANGCSATGTVNVTVIAPLGNSTPTTVNLPSIADITIGPNLNTPATTGTLTILESHPWVSGFEHSFLIKFDLSSIPSGAIITSAKLKLYNQHVGNYPSTINAHRITSTWSESSATWSNLGSNYIAGASASSTFNYSTQVINGLWDVTSDVQSMQNGSFINNGWHLKDDDVFDQSQPAWYFYSKESSYLPPVLEVIYSQSAPALSITPSSASICQGQSVLLTASGGNNYTWSPTDGLNQTTGAVVTASPIVSTLYTVSVPGSNGCNISKTVAVTISSLNCNSVLSATATVQNADCGLQNGTISLEVTGGFPPYTYAWSNGKTTKNITGLFAGTYEVVITDANGGSKSVNTSVNNKPLWGEKINITVNSDGTLSKTGSDGWNGYIYSQVKIEKDQNGSISMIAPNHNTSFMLGFTDGTVHSSQGNEYLITRYWDAMDIMILSNGIQTDGFPQIPYFYSSAGNNIIRIEKIGNEIVFYYNESEIKRVPIVNPNLPLSVVCKLYFSSYLAPSIGLNFCNGQAILSEEYYKPKRELDETFASLKVDELNVLYNEEYATTDASELNFEITNYSNQIVYSSSISDEKYYIQKGKNKISFECINDKLGNQAGYYILTITNSKKEKEYLRFKVNPSIHCD